MDDLPRCEEMGRNARAFILENLTKEVGTRKYVDVIKQFAVESSCWGKRPFGPSGKLWEAACGRRLKFNV